jgi:hypothetical protein
MATVSIPAFHVSDQSAVTGQAEVFIQSRQDAAHAGTFVVQINVQFNPGVNDYPVGNLTIRTALNDGAVGTFVTDNIELVNSHGQRNPTVFLTGRCRDDINPDAKGCRYWLMIANNKAVGPAPANATPDVIGFAIHDRMGNRIAYGCGPVRAGDINVLPV